jgi:hypothetical protein
MVSLTNFRDEKPHKQLFVEGSTYKIAGRKRRVWQRKGFVQGALPLPPWLLKAFRKKELLTEYRSLVFGAEMEPPPVYLGVAIQLSLRVS